LNRLVIEIHQQPVVARGAESRSVGGGNSHCDCLMGGDAGDLDDVQPAAIDEDGRRQYLIIFPEHGDLRHEAIALQGADANGHHALAIGWRGHAVVVDVVEVSDAAVGFIPRLQGEAGAGRQLYARGGRIVAVPVIIEVRPIALVADLAKELGELLLRKESKRPARGLLDHSIRNLVGCVEHGEQ
jgi:hypothetical protein